MRATRKRNHEDFIQDNLAEELFAGSGNGEDSADESGFEIEGVPEKRLATNMYFQAGYKQEEDPLSIYLKSLSKYPLLTAEEERTLSRQAKQGSELARKRMVQSNLRLVVNIAKRFNNKGMPLHDLIQEGNVGLIKAVDKFDGEKGFRFSTYATWWVRQSIQRALQDKGHLIRVPVHMSETAAKVARATKDYLVKEGRRPSTEELAKILSIEPEKLTRVMVSLNEPLSLDTTAGSNGDDDFDLGSQLADEKNLSPEEKTSINLCKQDVSTLLNKLSTRERDVISMRYGLNRDHPLTAGEVGRLLDLTEERVRQIEHKTMKKLRNLEIGSSMRDYLN